MIQYFPLPSDTGDFAKEIVGHSGDEQIVYKQANGRPLLISLFHPAGYSAGGSFPLLVWIHGGGWGSRKIFPDQADWAGDHLGFLARRYANMGYLCAGIDYRLMRHEGQAAEYELFDLYEDCADAVDFLLSQADERCIDKDRIVVLGESAGGYLAAALATFPWRNRECFRGAVLINAITDITDPLWQGVAPRQSAHAELEGKTLGEKQLLLSPVYHISSGICPTLLLHGAKDSVVYPFHAQKFHDLLNAQGGQVQLDWIADTDHAFMLAEYMKELNTPLHALTVGLEGLDAWLDKLMR